MSHQLPIRRVVMPVLDGLRPDAIARFELEHLARLCERGAHSLRGTTVTPSVTVAAITSLLTGVSPQQHGLDGDRLHLPREDAGIVAMPELLTRAGFPSSGFMAEVPMIFRGIAARVGRRLGLGTLRLGGRNAADILLAARSTLRIQLRGLILFHFPDVDRAGHDHGWMSPEYGDACRRLDATMGLLAALADDEHTLVIATADHGGGGVAVKDHESSHPDDQTIPIVLSGAAVRTTRLDDPSLLDIAPTVLWALGLEPPAQCTGRVLHEAFVHVGAPEAAEPAAAVA